MYIRASVTAGAKREQLTETTPDTFTIAVREPAQKNQANRRVCSLLAEHLSIEPRYVRIIAGHHAPRKIIHIDDAAYGNHKPEDNTR